MQLTGKTVLVTGSNRGIGAALVQALLDAGVSRVCAGPRSPQRPATILSRVTGGGSYSPSKAAAYSLTQGVRAELANQKTLVIGVMPGFVDTI
jgi:NAD(P)-dependent dehydrogenase (short-subunit alcohol dehydrogenase family)